MAQEAAELTEQAGAVSAGAVELFALVSPEIRPQAAALVQAAAVMEDKAREHEATIGKLREELGTLTVQVDKIKRDLINEKKADRVLVSLGDYCDLCCGGIWAIIFSEQRNRGTAWLERLPIPGIICLEYLKFYPSLPTRRIAAMINADLGPSYEIES